MIVGSRRILAIAASLIVVVPSTEAAAEAPAVTMPPEIARHVPQDLRSYYLAFLVSDGAPKQMSDEMFREHQTYMRRRTEEGVYHVFGPLTDGGRIRGLIILTAGSADEAKRIVSEDPSISGKIMDVEIHPVVLPNLSTLKVSYSAPEQGK